MTIAVLRPHTDDRQLRTQCVEQARTDGVSAAVVANLQHIDIAELPARCQRFEHVVLGITGQQRREPLRLDEQNDARLVSRVIVLFRRRPQHPQCHSSTAHGGGCAHLSDGRTHPGYLSRKVGHRTSRHNNPTHAHAIFQRADATVVVVMKVSDHYRFEGSHAVRTKSIA